MVKEKHQLTGKIQGQKVQIEEFKKLMTELGDPEPAAKEISQKLLFDSSFIYTVLSNTCNNPLPIPTSLPNITAPVPSTSKKAVKFPENSELKLNCRAFIFKIMNIMDMPIGITEILALVTQTHNLFLKDPNPHYVELGTQFAGLNFLGGTTLRDLLDRFHILLTPWPELLNELKTWQNRLVKSNPLYEIISTPNQFLTTRFVYQIINKFKNKGKENNPNKSGRGGFRSRGRGGKFSGRGRFKRKTSDENSSDSSQNSKTTKKEPQ